jgi:hypothetical protein
MMKFLFFTAFLFCACLSANAQMICDPANTRVVITGVLTWQDPAVNSFSDENRKDQELHDQLAKFGIADTASTLLLDSNGTLEKMNRAIKKQMRACNSESTFVFYYAGHGSKVDNSYYFCNYDMGKQTTTMFDVSTLYDLAAANFKGKRIILLADCCYSGSLLAVGKKIAGLGKEVIVLTSATSSNISTGNWTFTQTLLDDLRGDLIADANGDNAVSLAETAAEIKEAMKYREYQLSGYAVYNVDAEKTIVGKCPADARKPVSTGKLYDWGTYVYALDQKNTWRPARVVKSVSGSYTCQFYNYSVKQDIDEESSEIRPIYFPVYKAGQKIDVLWEGKYYAAEITEVDDAFMYIHYTGYDDSYDEWVMYDRVKTGNEAYKSIEWGGAWYPGYVLEKRDTALFITYEGYSHNWDEWVTPDRVK